MTVALTVRLVTCQRFLSLFFFIGYSDIRRALVRIATIQQHNINTISSFFIHRIDVCKPLLSTSLS